MVRPAGSVVAVEHRTLPLRARGDLVYQRQTYQGETWWLVKDPLALKYFRFREEACTVLQMLDGSVSLHDIKTEIESRYPTASAKYGQLHSLLGMLHKQGLILSEANGQGEQLFKRRSEEKRRKMWGQASSILWIRLPGFDPQPLLGWLYPKVRWFFSRWCMAACGLLALCALMLVMVRFGEFYARLPSFHQFFSANNLGWMMVALAVAKILHELGHGLTCKHFGGECHDIGVMFLVFTPCLYCDTSDSWILPNKWHRAAIGAAGMYVEVVLASLCTFVWWLTEPGLLHYLALNVMFMCSISTILFNSNPLLRYDGYYILSDILEIPNLSQKARNALLGLLREKCLGLPWDSEQGLPPRKRLQFALYAVASTVYRWFVLIVILWFLSKIFAPYGLQPIGHMLIAMSLIGIVVMPLWRTVKFFRVPGRINQVNRFRLLSTATVALAVLLAIALVPLPHHELSSVTIQPRGAERVYVDVPGVLRSVTVDAGDAVTGGEELAVLENPEVAQQLARLRGERQRLEQRLQNLGRQRTESDDEAARIPHTRQALASVEERLARLQEEQQRLRVVSRRGGTVIPAAYVPGEAADRSALPTWSGTLLDEMNLDRWLESGTLICLVGDVERMEAVLVVDQSQVEFVREGQLVELMLDEYPGETWKGRIDAVAHIDLRVAPRELSRSAGGDLNTEVDASGNERLASAAYQARVPLENSEQRLLPGFRGRAKIRVGERSLGEMLLRYLAATLRFG